MNYKNSPVSVIIPNYNRGSIIGETINNILCQTILPKEIIIVDDGSTDNSIDIISAFGDKVKLLQQSNKGPGAARNAGLKIASGDFIQFMDSDDFASKNKLEVQTKRMINENADIVYGPWTKVWVQDNKFIPQDVVLQQKPLPEKRSAIFWFLTEWSMVFQQCLVRKSLLEQVGGYREDMYSAEDSDLFLRLMLADAKLVHEKESLTFYRLDDFGKLTASGQNRGNRAFNLAQFYQAVVDLSRENEIVKKIINHPSFQNRVWENIRDLKSFCPEKMRAFGDLDRLVNNDSNIKKTRSWIKQKKGGLKKRLMGHRWPQCYKTGSFSSNQMNLIREIGFNL